MATKKQVAANRRNAKKSTGPRTSRGKAVSKLNAVSHGLRARNAIVPGEDAGDLEGLHRRLEEEFAPVGEVELMLVTRIVELWWRLRCAARVEAGIYAVLHETVEARERSDAQRSTGGVSQPPDWITRISRDDSSDVGGVDADAVPEAHEEPTSGQSLRLLGRSFLHDAGSTDAFGKLSRYESNLERSYFKALRELDRIQHARKSGEAATPVIIAGKWLRIPDHQRK
jgi:hypothetical protein